MERKNVQHITMKNLPKGEQPFEKCRILGPEFLSNEELLAVLLRTGSSGRRVTEMAGEILSAGEQYGGISNLSRIPLCELKQIKGVGEVRAAQIQCICEFGRRMQRTASHLERIRVQDPSLLASYMRSFFDNLDVEELWVVYLDSQNRILTQKCKSKGDCLSSQVYVREIYKDALQFGSVSLIMVHNHPSGNLSPSKADIDATKLVLEAGKILGIALLDHLIVCDQRYYSMREEELIHF